MQRLRFLTYFVLAFVFTGGISLVFIQHMGLFEISSVPVEVVASSIDPARPRAQQITEYRLKDRLEATLKPLRGKRIWEIDMSGVRASLARDEWVKDVLISRSFPNGLRILIRPKTTAGVLLTKQGSFIPVTEEGALLSALSVGSVPDVPVLRSEIFQTDFKKREAVVKFLTGLPDRGPLSVHNISEIAWTNEDGISLTLIQPKVDVRLGEDRVDLKAMRVAQVMSYLSTNSLKGRVIDASFSKKVLVRLRKGS